MNAEENQVEEALLGITFTKESLELVVISTGCTSEDDFEIDVNKGITGHPPYTLTVRRVKPDNCKAGPHPVTLKFPLSRLGLEGMFDLVVTNRFRSVPGAG